VEPVVGVGALPYPGLRTQPDPKTAAAKKFLLTTLPIALGSGVRIPYTLAVARFGGRNWTCISASLLLVPTVAAAIMLKPGVSFGTLLVLSALAGPGAATSPPRWPTSTRSTRSG
jgi:NNP family nitrate/nitrite transporter-like MFS transporter